MNDFVVVVLGGDMNTYGVARAFTSKYKRKTIVLGKHQLYPTSHSKLIEAYYYDDLLTNEGLIKALTILNDKYPQTKKILLGNTDYYVEHIMKNRDSIEKVSSNYIIPMVDLKMFNKLFNKESFYQLCEKYNLNYPKYQIFNFSKDSLEKYQLKFEFPIFIKPADSVLYSQYEFIGKQKGYKINNHEELETVINNIKKSNYPGNFIFQEYIEGNDESMFVITFYTSKDNKVQVATAGKILMHDRSPKLIGNYSAITNAYLEDLCYQIKDFLEKIKFTGICHFDVEYDIKRKKYYLFEMNIRQGRSNFYTYASGVNLTEYLIDDYIFDKCKEFTIAKQEFTVSIIPKCMLKYCLKKNNQRVKISNFYRFSLTKNDINILRCLYQIKWDYHIIRDYLKYNK